LRKGRAGGYICEWEWCDGQNEGSCNAKNKCKQDELGTFRQRLRFHLHSLLVILCVPSPVARCASAKGMRAAPIGDAPELRRQRHANPGSTENCRIGAAVLPFQQIREMGRTVLSTAPDRRRPQAPCALHYNAVHLTCVRGQGVRWSVRCRSRIPPCPCRQRRPASHASASVGRLRRFPPLCARQGHRAWLKARSAHAGLGGGTRPWVPDSVAGPRPQWPSNKRSVLHSMASLPSPPHLCCSALLRCSLLVARLRCSARFLCARQWGCPLGDGAKGKRGREARARRRRQRHTLRNLPACRSQSLEGTSLVLWALAHRGSLGLANHRAERRGTGQRAEQQRRMESGPAMPLARVGSVLAN
jgi:hypothetical protein